MVLVILVKCRSLTPNRRGLNCLVQVEIRLIRVSKALGLGLLYQIMARVHMASSASGPCLFCVSHLTSHYEAIGNAGILCVTDARAPK